MTISTRQIPSLFTQAAHVFINTKDGIYSVEDLDVKSTTKLVWDKLKESDVLKNILRSIENPLIQNLTLTATEKEVFLQNKIIALFKNLTKKLQIPINDKLPIDLLMNPTPDAFVQAIKTAGNKNDLETATKVFKLGRLLQISKMPDMSLYKSLIKVAGKNGDMKLAKKLFDETCFHYDSVKVNDSIYQAANESMKDICNTLIKVASDRKDLQSATDAFVHAALYNIIDLPILHNFMQVAGKNGSLIDAVYAFNRAKSDNLANIETYKIFIEVAKLNRAIDAAIKAENEAKRLFPNF